MLAAIVHPNVRQGRLSCVIKPIHQGIPPDGEFLSQTTEYYGIGGEWDRLLESGKRYRFYKVITYHNNGGNYLDFGRLKPESTVAQLSKLANLH